MWEFALAIEGSVRLIEKFKVMVLDYVMKVTGWFIALLSLAEELLRTPKNRE